ncbi:MAG TPA: NAD(P)-binding domain-containing protein [Chthoniobacterales bacterium]|nr:NAD(P)-binding domain-containing protein [Chthoniobacterales bacterium]
MSIRTRKNVGVIGLGIIGQRVADNLREHGFHVFVWNRTPRPVPNFVGSPAEVAELCDFIQIFVSDDEALLQMAQRITRDLSPNHIVMAHCTVAPDTMRAAAEIVEKRGARFLDAPFTGSKTAAENGQLVYYVGGDEAALRLARPVLEASSKEIIEIGKVGDATTVKVATNMVTAASVQGAAEALALISKSGLPVEKFAAAMRNNGSNSPTLDMKLPMMMEGNFEPHFSVKHMLKDVVIATRLARGFGMEFGATDASRHGLTEEMRQGRGDDDYSSLLRQYLPAGRSLKSDQQVSNGEDDQPRFAGLDEAKGAVAEKMPETAPVESTVSAPAEAVIVEPVATPEVAVAAETPSSSLQSGSDAQEIAQPAPPDQAGGGEEPRAGWGGFWRRRTDD